MNSNQLSYFDNVFDFNGEVLGFWEHYYIRGLYIEKISLLPTLGKINGFNVIFIWKTEVIIWIGFVR